MRRLQAPLYPLAFPIAYLLNFWSASAVYFTSIGRPLLVAIAVSIGICVVSGVLAGRTVGGLAASALIVGLLAPAGSWAALALFAVGLFALAVGVVQRARHAELRSAPVVDRVMWTLASIVVLAVGIKLVAGGSIANAVADVQHVATPRGPVDAPETRPPDIVIVMLDGFPGDAAATLAAEAGSPYDPDAFPNALDALGFHVQRNSHSNYLLTPMTLASMFEMRHLVDIPGLVADHGAGGQGGVFRQVLNDSRGLEILHQRGYELVWVDGGFNHTEVRRVDRWINPAEPNELDVRILASTTFGGVVSTLAPDLVSGLQRRRILETLDEVPDLIDEPHDRPRFVFVHVPSPHAPWVFGPDGDARTDALNAFYSDNIGDRPIDRNEAIRRVFDQATFVAGQTTVELAALLDRPDPPVVVVFSDHGPGTSLSFSDPGSTDLVERSSSFFAAFTPGHPDLYREFTTPINILPALFGGYLGVDVPKQPDTIYAWSDSQFNLFPVEVPGVAPP